MGSDCDPFEAKIRCFLLRFAHIAHRGWHEFRFIPNRVKGAIAWKFADNKEFPQSDFSVLVEQLENFTCTNRNTRYLLNLSAPVGVDGEFDYVGVQPFHSSSGVCVPNGADNFAIVDCNGSVERIAFDKRGEVGPFRWTGGSLWNGSLVCFPRSSNKLLLFDLDSRKSRLIDLGQKYIREHHYGGVLVGDKVYQPPRDEGHILRIDLKTMECKRISIAPEAIDFKPRYCGSVLHPNGLVYFLPEWGRVIEFDPATDEFRYIGKPVNAMTFSAVMAPDGCLYGFSAYSRGILRVDPKNGSVGMVRRDIGCPGAYGTRLGINGKLYSVPGDGDAVLEFDSSTLEVRELCALGVPGVKAKCAGSATLRDGTLIFAPAFGKDAYFLKPDKPTEIPQKIFGLFNDCY